MTLRHTIRHATGNPGGALPGAAVHAKDPYTPGAPRLRELLIGLVSQGSYQLVVNLDKVGFLDSTGLGYWSGPEAGAGPRGPSALAEGSPPTGDTAFPAGTGIATEPVTCLSLEARTTTSRPATTT